MRIGIDMLGVQSAASRGRGIGRYAASLARALVERADRHEFVLYAHDGLPTDSLPDDPRATLRRLPPGVAAPTAIEWIAAENPDRVDRLLILSPFELHQHYNPPPRPADGTPVATVLYDLLPFLEPERYLTWPQAGRWFYRNLERIRGYDRLLAISDATARDARRLLGRDERRIVTIGAASDPTFFTPDRTLPLGHWPRQAFRALGIQKPYVFTVVGDDPRKNLVGLLDAFERLPAALRERHQLVVTCALDSASRQKIQEWSNQRGLDSNLVLTGELPDDTLRLLYQRSAAFAFPSRYEGFGLPILEAMHCGAAIVAGKNSSQPEVLGDAGLLANVDDPADLSARLTRLLTDPDVAESCRIRALARAARFTWSEVAERAIEAIETARPSRLSAPRRGGKNHGEARRRLALFSPWPPKETGVTDYSLRLARALREHYDVDFYHDPAYEPNLGAEARWFRAIRPEHFAQHQKVNPYRGVLHQIGNSYHHAFVYDSLTSHSGVVTLHDFHLASFQCWRACRTDDPVGFIRREIQTCEGPRAAVDSLVIDGPLRVARDLDRELVQRDLPLNRHVIEAARAVIVHSGWAWRRLQELYPQWAARTFVIPHGADPVPADPQRRARARREHGLPAEGLVVASFGILHDQKMNLEAMRSFVQVRREMPSAVLVFVGPDHSEGAARAEAQRLGIVEQVRFLGRRNDDEFLDLVAMADVGISLRRPPTFGETSGALLHLLRHGVPSVVIDTDAFADYPDDAVAKVRWERDGQAGLDRALIGLACDPARRATMSAAALGHVQRHHRWDHVAERYARLIERVAEEATPASAVA